jgi:hypothetical protein
MIFWLNSYQFSKYIELCIILPEKWDMDNENWRKPINYWPIELLKNIGRYPCLVFLLRPHLCKPWKPAVSFIGLTKTPGRTFFLPHHFMINQ